MATIDYYKKHHLVARAIKTDSGMYLPTVLVFLPSNGSSTEIKLEHLPGAVGSEEEAMTIATTLGRAYVDRKA